MEQRNRRRSDQSKLEHLRQIILYGDISFTVLLGGLGLILWAAFGVLMFTKDLQAYSSMFPYGNGWFWVANYTGCGLAMWYLVSAQFPPFLSLALGSWVCVIWTWAALARMTAVATLQTGNATSIIYILLGLLIIHRSARNDTQKPKA